MIRFFKDLIISAVEFATQCLYPFRDKPFFSGLYEYLSAKADSLSERWNNE